MEAVGNAYKIGEVGRNPDPEKVKRLLTKGANPDFPDLYAQHDFITPWLPDNIDNCPSIFQSR